MYTAALSMGVGGGIVIAGLITITHPWRYIYWIATALIGALTILVILTFPETTYKRSPATEPSQSTHASVSYSKDTDALETPNVSYHETETGDSSNVKRQSFAHSLRIFTSVYTQESLLKLFVRPCALLVLPPVLWATLVMSVTIGFLVAITSNFAPAFQATYNFKAWQSGLCFISGLTGSAIGIFFGGHISDMTADYFTKRNGGIREPEMRLPSMVVGGIAGPLALVLYGVGIGHKLHWMVPTLGLGLRTSLPLPLLKNPH
jgi:MFS family permease